MINFFWIFVFLKSVFHALQIFWTNVVKNDTSTAMPAAAPKGAPRRPQLVSFLDKPILPSEAPTRRPSDPH